MNKQELIEKFEQFSGHGSRCYIERNEILNLVKQLDEPEKVKVPQFVDDVIEGAREHSPELEDALHYACSNGSQEFTEWYQKKSNRDLFARAWLDGYEVKKEKRYLVKIKGNIKENMLVYGELFERYYFTKSLSLDNAIYSHTRKELDDADFGWVFDCPGIEIEEVK